MSYQLFKQGQRLYITSDERKRLLNAAKALSALERTFCETLIFTGCRISEALALRSENVDISGGLIVFESLKKRRKGVYRAVPVPDIYLQRMRHVHHLRRTPSSRANRPLWSWRRTKGWEIVKAWFTLAGIKGEYASPKGLRHGFAMHAIACGVPLTLVQKWLGHSRLEITQIYLQATGPEEHDIAQRMW